MKKTTFLILFIAVISSLFAQKPVPYLQNPTDSSIWINWRTKYLEGSTVIYGESNTSLGLTKEGITKQLSSSEDDNYSYNYHCVQLSGLKPDTKYFYQVKSGNEESEIYSFKTQPEAGSGSIYRFIILGDHQILDDRYERLVKAAKEVAQQKYGSPIEDHINLITNVGDQVDIGTLKQYDIVHFDGSELLSPNIPIMTIVGNHDTYGPADRKFYNEHFLYNEIEYQGIKSNTNYYYAMQQGRALFLMLSSEDTNNTQLMWANKVIQKAKKDSNIDWIFSYNHRPIQAEQYVGDISVWVRDQIMPLLNTTEKSVMNVAGHHHLYHRGQLRDYPTYHIISGGASYDQRWGQGTEQDFDDVQKTIDYWPFQIVELNFENKSMSVETYVIGNQVETFSRPILVDEFFRVFGENKPNKPSIKTIPTEPIKLPYTFESTSYSTEMDYDYNSVQFQISENNDFSSLQYDLIRDYENIFGEHPMGGILTDLNKGVDIFKLELDEYSLYNGNHYIRVRHRDTNLEWSEWSDALEFTTIDGKPGATTLTMPKNQYSENEEITFTYKNASGLDEQWVGIYKIGQIPANVYSTAYKYIEGENGSVSFKLSNPDTYYAALFKDGGYILLAETEPFTVGDIIVPQIIPDKSKYHAGEEIKISLINAPKYDKDWIGIYKIGDTPGSSTPSTAWNYVSTALNDVITIQSEKLVDGFYYITYLLRDGYSEPGERVTIQIGNATTSLEIDSEIYKYKEPIIFYFENVPGNLLDYIGIYKEGENNKEGELVKLLYLEGKYFGHIEWEQELSAGNYFAQIFLDNTSEQISEKVFFTVKKDEVGMETIIKNSFRIYPNPAKTYTNIQFDSHSNGTLYVLNTQGIPLQEYAVKTNNILITLSGYPCGIYFLKFNEQVKKLVIQ